MRWMDKPEGILDGVWNSSKIEADISFTSWETLQIYELDKGSF